MRRSWKEQGRPQWHGVRQATTLYRSGDQRELAREKPRLPVTSSCSNLEPELCPTHYVEPPCAQAKSDGQEEYRHSRAGRRIWCEEEVGGGDSQGKHGNHINPSTQITPASIHNVESKPQLNSPKVTAIITSKVPFRVEQWIVSPQPWKITNRPDWSCYFNGVV